MPGTSATRVIRHLGVALAVASIAIGCMPPASGGGPLGFDRAPEGLEPASPTLRAKDIAFDRRELEVPAGTPFVLVLENLETPPHNVSIYREASFQGRVFEGKVVSGPATLWYPVGALEPGRYFFQCDIHPIPAMQGTITAS